MEKNHNWQPASLWDYLKEETIGDYQWNKEQRDFANCYVCYHNRQEIGFIPITYEDTDIEWHNWWKTAYQRHNNKLTIRKLMEEIVERHRRQKPK